MTLFQSINFYFNNFSGMLLKDPHDVFDFVVKLISQAKRRPGSFQLEGLYHCLNRTILYLLSRGTDSIADQMPVLETLHKLTNHRLVYCSFIVSNISERKFTC